MHAALKLNDIIIEWGCGLCGDSLILPFPDLDSIILSINLEDKIMKEQTSFMSRLWEFIKNFEFIKALKFIFSRDFMLKTLADDELDLISEVCVYYNKNYDYNPYNRNCQIFVDDLLQKINITTDFDGELGKIIEKLKGGQKEVKMEFEGKEFHTRKELDDFVKGKDFSKLPKNDRKLLFSYEGMFNGFHRADKENKDYQSTEEMKQYWNKLTEKYEDY